MGFATRPTPEEMLDELWRRMKQQDTVRDLGNSSISPGDGMLRILDGSGNVIGGMGDLPDGTFGIGVMRYGQVTNINDLFYDRSQVDTAFTTRDTSLAAYKVTVNNQFADRYTKADVDTAFKGRDDSLSAYKVTVNNQFSDRYTKGQVDSAFSTRDGRIASAQNAASGAQGAADSAATAARNAQNDASGALQAAVANATTIVALTARVNSLQDQIDKMRGP